MSEDREMTTDERRKYLRIKQQRYARASRKEKGQLLDEMEEVAGLHRKHLITLLAGDLHASHVAGSAAAHTVQSWTTPCE